MILLSGQIQCFNILGFSNVTVESYYSEGSGHFRVWQN
ncbi:MAG: hypothetical protein ACI8UC_000443, partial [Psychromonas sp.]